VTAKSQIWNRVSSLNQQAETYTIGDCNEPLSVLDADYMKRAAPGCDIPHPDKANIFRGGAAHEKDSVCWR